MDACIVGVTAKQRSIRRNVSNDLEHIRCVSKLKKLSSAELCDSNCTKKPVKYCCRAKNATENLQFQPAGVIVLEKIH